MDSVLKGGYKMNINKSKTKVMEWSLRKSGDAEVIRLGNEAIKVVDEFCYLGSKVTSDGLSGEDIRCRMALGRKAFMKKRNLLTSNIDLSVRKSFLECGLVRDWNVENKQFGQEEDWSFWNLVLQENAENSMGRSRN